MEPKKVRKNLKLIDMAMNPKVQLPLDLTVFGELDMENVTGISAIGEVDAGAEDPASATVTDGTSSSSASSATLPANEATAAFPTPKKATFDQVDATSTSVNSTIVEKENQHKKETPANDSTVPVIITQDVDVAVDAIVQKEQPKQQTENISIVPLTMSTGTKKKKKPKFRAKAKPGGRSKAKRLVK